MQTQDEPLHDKKTRNATILLEIKEQVYEVMDTFEVKSNKYFIKSNNRRYSRLQQQNYENLKELLTSLHGQ